MQNQVLVCRVTVCAKHSCKIKYFQEKLFLWFWLSGLRGVKGENQQLCNSLPKKKSLISPAIKLEKDAVVYLGLGGILLFPESF